MRHILFLMSLVFLASTARAENVVFQRTQQKKWADYNVDGFGYYIGIKDRAGVVVHISNFQSQPNYVERYDDEINVPGLSFDTSIGKWGAIVFTLKTAKTICANKTFFRFHDTGLCSIEIADQDQTYTIRLHVNRFRSIRSRLIATSIEI